VSKNFFDDSNSVWHDFHEERHLKVMRAPTRVHHESRFIFYEFVKKTFKDTFNWLDIGLVGMVDYEYLMKEGLQFNFVGADLSESILKDSEKYLKNPGHILVRWNVENSLMPEQLKKHYFDLVSCRHVLNHCNYYEDPLRNIQKLLKNQGYIFIVLHLPFIDDDDRLIKDHGWEVSGLKGEVIGNYYNKEKFLNYFGNLYKLIEFFQTGEEKPNDVIIGQKIGKK
jgi:ubiquinone/menaquinone biosynthesis C-methylase UbiE